MVEKDSRSTYIDMIDRVLDKGVVFDAWIRISPAGIDLIAVDAHVIVASIDTYVSSGARSAPPQASVGDPVVAKDRLQAKRRIRDIDRDLKSLAVVVRP